MVKRDSRKVTSHVLEFLLSTPSLLWLIILFVIPTALVFIISLKPSDMFGGVNKGWTLETVLSLLNPSYPTIIWRTIRLSIITTILCLLIATPCGYYIARAKKTWRQVLVLLVIIPFWTSFLLRVFAWKVLLHPEGPVKHLLVWLRVIGPDTLLLYNETAILLVMVYTSLPFAILPIYAAAEKFDYRLVEAARDLGASKLQAFYSIFLPGISRGLLSAVLVVLIPSLGSYIIPDLVGSPTCEMIGNKIAQRAFSDRNLPHASALSAGLTVSVLIPLIIALMVQRKQREEQKQAKTA